ncbi:MAG: VOC family protein [Okeania sp. SIO3I5]|uniref:VOC family protein n=1 Tax=Okeania sp. SIO3I5 TaxID=2607805 RepID=UPI0013B8272B|nr:VOC family protein [Okeania sp. SIO3I5]NEQ39840.1 VOC family protein [Okeania sp. SIO3I5]
MKTLLKVFQTLVIALVISVTLLGNPWMASPASAQGCDTPYVPLLRETGFVHRVNVPDLDKAMYFYGEGLGLSCNPTFYEPPFWAEFYSEDDPATSIGLYANPYEPFEPKTVGTQIVPDIAAACANLKEKGIPIDKSEYAGSYVCLASFTDPYGNELAYRQERWFGSDPKEECLELTETVCSPGF